MVRIRFPPAESRLRTGFLQRRVRGLLFAARQDRLLTDHREGAKMDGTEIDDQIKKAELYETVKQTLMRLLDDPQVQQKMLEILLQRLGRNLS
jgi:hypothetical protein